MAVPNLSRVGVLWNPDEPNSTPVPKSAAAAASIAGLQLVPVDMRKLQDIESAFDALTKERVEALIVGGPVVLSSRSGSRSWTSHCEIDCQRYLLIVNMWNPAG